MNVQSNLQTTEKTGKPVNNSSKCDIPYTRWGKNRLKIVCMENNTTVNNNTGINLVFHMLSTVNPLLPHPEYITNGSFTSLSHSSIQDVMASSPIFENDECNLQVHCYI